MHKVWLYAPGENASKWDVCLSQNIMCIGWDEMGNLLEYASKKKKSGFRISHKKTHYQTKNPIITGVICQNNRLLAPLGYKKKIAILSKYPIEKSIKNKLQGINAYLSTIKNVNRSL